MTRRDGANLLSKAPDGVLTHRSNAVEIQGLFQVEEIVYFKIYAADTVVSKAHITPENAFFCATEPKASCGFTRRSLWPSNLEQAVGVLGRYLIRRCRALIKLCEKTSKCSVAPEPSFFHHPNFRGKACGRRRLQFNN